MTLIDSIYGDLGYIRQWGLVSGYPECVADGVPPYSAGALAALQTNAGVATLIATVEPYEAAQALVAKGEPNNGEPAMIPDPAWVDPGDGSVTPQIANQAYALQPTTIEGVDANGVATTAPNPAWTAYNAATALIAAASATTIAHALWRGPVPTDPTKLTAWDAAATTVETELARLAALPLAIDPRPVPASVAMWQAKTILTAQGLLTAADTTIAAYNNPAVSSFWTNATSLDRADPIVAAIASSLGLTSPQIDALFRAAVAVTL